MRPNLRDLTSVCSPLVFLTILTMGVLPVSGAKTKPTGLGALHGAINMTAVNKTIREFQRRNLVLKKMEHQMKGMPMPGMKSRKGGSIPSWRQKVNKSMPPLVGRPSGMVKPRVTSTQALPPKNIIQPTKIERNMLSFPLGPDVINGNGSPVSRIRLFIYVWKREEKSKAKPQPSNLVSTRDLLERGRKRNRRANNSIKIRVFMSNKDGVKGKRIAQLKKKIYESKFQAIKLPISMIKNISEDPDNKSGLVHIRVECSRCNRKTRLFLPGNDKKRCRRNKKSRSRKNSNDDNNNNNNNNNSNSVKSKDGKQKGKENDKDTKSKRKSRHRRRRRNCAKTRSLENSMESTQKKPFILLIDEHLMPPTSRSKRDTPLPQVCPSSSKPADQSNNLSRILNTDDNSTSSSFASTNNNCCQKLKTYINFSHLNLDREIVSPSGFFFTTCVTTCSKDTKSQPDFAVIKNTLSHKLNSLLSSSSPPNGNPVQTNRDNNSLGGKISNILKRSRLKEELPTHVQSSHTSHCSPSSRTDLSLLYFNEHSTLVLTTIPGFVITNCQCNNSKL